MLCRLATYVDEPELLSAGAAIDQLRSALAGNVWYLDGGWQSLVEGLRARAAAAGAELSTSARVDCVRSDATGVTVELASGATLRGSRGHPRHRTRRGGQDCSRCPGDAPLVRFARGRVPVRAATLEVALARLPRPSRAIRSWARAPVVLFGALGVGPRSVRPGLPCCTC
jgi:hypothetical protein